MVVETDETKVVVNDDNENEVEEQGSPAEARAVEGPMADYMSAAPKRPGLDDVVEGPIIAIGRARVFVDLHPFGTGIIFGREYLSARETLKNVNIGDTIASDENPEPLLGYKFFPVVSRPYV